MKRWIHAATEMSQAKQISELTNKIWDFIAYEMFEQNRQGYYKQVRKQFTVNGVKYVMKNYSNGKLSVTNPEGKELFGYSFGRGASKSDAQDIATSIINDAYGDDTDLYNKKVDLGVRSGYTSYGRNSGGTVNFGEYVDRLRRYAKQNKSYLDRYPDRKKFDVGDTDSRYAAVLIKAWWSSNDEYILFRDDANELINICEKFIEDGAKTPDGQDSSIGSYTYRFYANVIDTETGKELYADESESYGREE